MLYFKLLNGQTIKTDDWFSFNETITEMSVQINENEYLVLEGFEAYCRLINKGKILNRPIQGIIGYVLFGKKGKTVVKITLDLIHSKISQETIPIDKAYQNKPLNPSLWKKGLLYHPKVYIKKI
jgi:dsRNA-specific ribonuclease